jgi:DNA-binding NarL/FixJ family response regulator
VHTPPVRIVYAEDQRLFRECFQKILEENDHYHLLALCKDGAEALEAVKKHKPDILLLDLNMPMVDGRQVIEALHAAHSPVKIIVLSMYEKEELQLYLLSKGVKGFISKEAHRLELYEAIDLVASGLLYAPEHLVSIIMQMDKKEYEAKHVSKSDLQLTALVKKGLSHYEIHREMGISKSGIEKKKKALAVKLHAESFYDAVDVLGQGGFMFRKEGKGG